MKNNKVFKLALVFSFLILHSESAQASFLAKRLVGAKTQISRFAKNAAGQQNELLEDAKAGVFGGIVGVCVGGCIGAYAGVALGSPAIFYSEDRKRTAWKATLVGWTLGAGAASVGYAHYLGGSTGRKTWLLATTLPISMGLLGFSIHGVMKPDQKNLKSTQAN